jgi:hypothetical protein
MGFSVIPSSSGGDISSRIVDAKGDIIAATAADVVSRLGVGSDGQVLTAASGQTTGLQWATPAAASNSITLLGSVAASGTSFGISGINQTYTHLQIRFINISTSSGSPQPSLQVNGITAANQYSMSTGSSFFNNNMYTCGSGNGSSPDSLISGVITIYNYSDSTLTSKVFNSTIGYFAGGNGSGAFNRGGSVNGTSDNANNGVGAITAFNIIDPNGYSYNQGTVQLYGVK